LTKKNSTSASWWNQSHIEQHHGKLWRIGTLSLLVRCLPNEWQIAYSRKNESESDLFKWNVSDSDQTPENFKEQARYVFHETSGLVSFSPLLADRPMICRPRTPFNLTAGEEITLYVSTPLWLEISVGKTQKKLTEIPIHRPSDTWFGPTTREGELCYASNTAARLILEELPQRPHRAVTPVLIRNLADSVLSIERLNVPAPLLPLVQDADGQMWTPKVTLTREKDGDMAGLKIDTKAPKEASEAKVLRKPRIKTSSGALIRAFNAVFG